MKHLLLLSTLLLTVTLNALGTVIKIDKAKYDVSSPDEVTLTEYKNDETIVTIPASVTDTKTGKKYAVIAVAPEAFKGSKAVSVTLPESVIMLYPKCFADAKKLMKVNLPASIDEIPEQAFKGCSDLTEVNMPGVKQIGEKAFSGSKHLTAIDLPSTLTTIGVEAFRKTGLKSVTIPASVTLIETGAFNRCGDLTSLRLEGSYTPIEMRGDLFDYTPLADIYIGREINYTKTGYSLNHPFDSNPNLKRVTFGANVKTAGNDLLKGCEMLEKITIENDSFNPTVLTELVSRTQSKVCKISDTSGNSYTPGEFREVLARREAEARHQAQARALQAKLDKFDSTKDLDALEELYTYYGTRRMRAEVIAVMDKAMSYFKTLPVAKLKRNTQAGEMLGNMYADYVNLGESAKALGCAELGLKAEPKDVYWPTQIVVQLCNVGRYAEAAKKFPNALRLATENGKYMVPDELENAAYTLRENGYNVSLTVSRKKR